MMEMWERKGVAGGEGGWGCYVEMRLCGLEKARA